MGASPTDAGQSDKRELGFWLTLALVIGNLIGSGIFLLPTQLAPFGWNAVFGWVLTILGALSLAFVFARLAKTLPGAAGPYAFVHEAFGPLPAYAVSWSYWIAAWVGNAAIAIAAISYLSLFAPALAATPGLGAAAAIGLMIVLTAINCFSMRAGAGVQAITVILKLAPLLVVILIAALVLGEGRQIASTPLRTEDLRWSAITASAALTLWAMTGFESATVAARKVRDPERNVARATLAGTALTGAIYLLVSSPIILLLPASEVAASNAPIALFVERYWSNGLGLVVALFAAVSAIGACNGFILIQGELPLAMARDGTFPRWFAKTNRHGVAARAQIVSTGLAALLIAANASRSVAGLFAFMALLATVAALVLYLACALAALYLLKRGRLAPSAALGVIATVATAYSLWALWGAGYEATGWGAVLLIAGLPIYVFMKRGRSSPVAVESPNAPPE